MISLNFNPFPLLETERLFLRNITEDDTREMFFLRSDAEVMKYIARPLHKNMEETVVFIKNIHESHEKQDLINWAIALKSDNILIGTIGYYRMQKEHDRAEVGYMLHPDFRKKGIMQEALTAIIEYGFTQMNLHSIEAVIDPRNKASETILVRNNFVKEAHFKENYFFDGAYLDSAHYSLLTTKKQ
jgi:ribosomal-protein-alanine N-acetyltransferase